MEESRHVRAAVFLTLLCVGSACAQDIASTVGGLNNLLYGVAAGIAALMITIHAIRWKTAGSPAEREAAKKGILNVILGLALIIVAASLVEMVYKKPETSPESLRITLSGLPPAGTVLFLAKRPFCGRARFHRINA